MPGSVNSVVLIGNLAKDPELRHTAGGTAVANLRIAVNDRVKRQGEWTDVAYFFDITVWGNQGEACAQYLSKGRKVGVQGKLTQREYEAKDGTKRYPVEIVADTVQFLTPRDGDGGGGPATGARADSPDFVPPASSSDDDIPF